MVHLIIYIFTQTCALHCFPPDGINAALNTLSLCRLIMVKFIVTVTIASWEYGQASRTHVYCIECDPELVYAVCVAFCI